MQRDEAAGPREAIDWDRIEREYRTDQLSNRELARVFGITEAAIRKRAKARDWKRDLRPKLIEAIDRKITEATAAEGQPVPTPPAGAQPSRDDQVVDAAASRAKDIVLGHRRTIAQLRTRAELLSVAYDALASEAGQDWESFGKVSNGLDKLVGLHGSIISLERQAYCLDRPGQGDEGAGGGAQRLTGEQRVAMLTNLRARMLGPTAQPPV